MKPIPNLEDEFSGMVSQMHRTIAAITVERDTYRRAAEMQARRNRHIWLTIHVLLCATIALELARWALTGGC